MSEPLLRVEGLKKYFPVHQGLFSIKPTGYVKAVDGVSFQLMKGETLGIVGESGCGKSTTGRCIMQLLEPTDGEVWFAGQNICALSKAEKRLVKKDMQFIFQDPFGSLNPRLTVGDIIAEPMRNYKIEDATYRLQQVNYLLDRVGLKPYHAQRYAHEFSGGQRQRIGIARALSLQPQLLICDEPVSALDVSIQAQVVNLLAELQREMQLTMIFIAHDLGIVKHVSDRIAVMYLGHIVETGSSRDIFSCPRHPYTKALLSAVPVPDPDHKKQRIILRGDVPSPANPPSGCTFHTRCPRADAICRSAIPLRTDCATDHQVWCHHLD